MQVSDLELIIDAAKNAGAIATKYFRKDPQVWDKPDGAGPVTEADLAVNEYLETTLRSTRSSYGWLSEETEDHAARLKTDRQFIVDPIDGTRAFIEGNNNWSHSIAVCENGAITHAVVYLPLRDQMYTAEKGKGAFLNGNPITATSQGDLHTANVLTAKPNMAPSHWQNAVPDFNVSFRSSLAYRLALVAHGRFDAMLTLRRTWEWDVAAGVLIASEAGAKSVTKDGETPRFNNPEPSLNCIITGAPKLTDNILNELA